MSAGKVGYFLPGLQASLPSRKISIYTNFLSPLELNYTPFVDHQLDRSIADRAERLLQLPEQRRREVERMKPEIGLGMGR
jgi:hypothetical protein